jgi:peptidoglycan-associated lipoprotein
MKLSLALVGAAAALLAACSSTPKLAPEAAAVPAAQAPAPAAAVPAPVTASRPDYLDAASEISRRRSVYFGFDDSAVRPQDRPVLELQGKYLAAHPDVAVRVEGNTDERGSSEYNLALGQRRAEATVNALKLLGVKDSQMEPVSWGSEKPAAQGHDEQAWSENRRADVAYPTK